MNKRMRELLSIIEAKTAEAKTFMSGENKDVAKAAEIMKEVENLQAEYNTEKKIFEASKGPALLGEQFKDGAGKEPKEKNAEEKFVDAFKAIMKGAVPSEGVDADGGYTVPEDIQTNINKWAEADYSLLNDIDVVNVTTNKGARTYQKKGEADTFTDLDENGAITGKLTAPRFERITYSIQDRAGFMPVSNDLISDSSANIIQVITEWIGKSKVATSNAKILNIIKSKTQQNFKDINGIKKAVNVTLGQAYKGGTKIYTNDDGLNYFDTLEDKNGRPLLNADPTDSAKLQLRCGTVVIPIRVIPNKILASAGTKIPVIVGNLKAGIRKWDRQSMSIKASDTASIGEFNAFENNMTLIRAIVRDDYAELDRDSWVNGYIDTNTAAAPSGE